MKTQENAYKEKKIEETKKKKFFIEGSIWQTTGIFSLRNKSENQTLEVQILISNLQYFYFLTIFNLFIYFFLQCIPGNKWDQWYSDNLEVSDLIVDRTLLYSWTNLLIWIMFK